MKLDAKSAAAIIAERDPKGDESALAFYKEVISTLGLDYSEALLAEVAAILAEENISPHFPVEYPRWVDGVIVNDEAEEAALTGGEKPSV